MPSQCPVQQHKQLTGCLHEWVILNAKVTAYVYKQAGLVFQLFMNGSTAHQHAG